MNKIISLFSNFFGFLSKKTEKEIKILEIENNENTLLTKKNNKKLKIKTEIDNCILKLQNTTDESERQKIIYRIRVLLGE